MVKDMDTKSNWISSYLKVMITIHRFLYIIAVPLLLILYLVIAVISLLKGNFILAILIILLAILAVGLGIIPILYALDYTYKRAIKKK